MEDFISNWDNFLIIAFYYHQQAINESIESPFQKGHKISYDESFGSYIIISDIATWGGLGCLAVSFLILVISRKKKRQTQDYLEESHVTQYIKLKTLCVECGKYFVDEPKFCPHCGKSTKFNI